MKHIEKFVVTISSYHVAALRRDRLTRENVEVSLSLSAGFTAASPLLFLLVTIAAILIPITGFDVIKIPTSIAVLIIIFGAAAITDRIYERNSRKINGKAERIVANPDRGASWARRRLLMFFFLQIAISVVIGIFAKIFSYS